MSDTPEVEEEGPKVDWYELSVLIPTVDPFPQVHVVTMGQLMSHLDDGESLNEAVINSAFDGTMHFGMEHIKDELMVLLERVARSNYGGDYWAELKEEDADDDGEQEEGT
jgi:hypothetical protein